MMTSRERVLKALNHEEPDRVPIDIGGTIVTGIHIDEYCKLAKYIGMDGAPPKLIEQFMMVARNDERMMEWLHCDFIHLESTCHNWGYINKDWKLWRTYSGNDVLVPGEFDVEEKDGYLYLRNTAGNIAGYMPVGGLYFDKYIRKSDINNIELNNINEWKETLPVFSDEEFRMLETRAKFMHTYTDYAVLGGFCRASLSSTNELYCGHTFEEWMVLLLTDPDYAAEVLDAQVEIVFRNLVGYLQAVGDYIDVIYISGMDFGSQRTEIFSPELFNELYVPRYKKINDYIHAHTDAKVLLHTCGSVVNIMEGLIESGVDALTPVQVTAGNMDPKMLKEKFGDRIVFWGGGANTQTTLPHGTPEEVRAQVKERLEAFAPGGGYVFNPIHNLQADIPAENIEAMIDAVMEFGTYPIKGGK